VSNSFCRYDDRLLLGGRRACQLLMDDIGGRRIRYQLHPHWQNKLLYVLKRRQQIVSHYSKRIHIQHHKNKALSVITIHATRVCFVYNYCVPLTTTRQYRSETLTNRDLSHTSRNEVKELRSQRYLSLSPSLPPSLGHNVVYSKDAFYHMVTGHTADNSTIVTNQPKFLNSILQNSNNMHVILQHLSSSEGNEMCRYAYCDVHRVTFSITCFCRYY
jgi:hypothetical protein